MTERHWAAAQAAARLLEPYDREAVLGDLAESGESGWRALFDVVGLVILRQLLHLRKWQPWAAVFGFAVPLSFLLMGVSVAVSSMSVRLVGGLVPAQGGIGKLLCTGLLLVGCSWACGFAIGSLSRRTLWVSAASSLIACSFCFGRFNETSLSRFCLFLFLFPAIWGIRHALRPIRIHSAFAIFLATAMTSLLIYLLSSRSPWTLNWALAWPAWYVVATSARREPRERCDEEAQA